MTFTPRTWAVGEVVPAATMNTEIRDQFNSFFGAWTAYTPTWTTVTTPPSLGNGTLVGQYMKIGRTCHVVIMLTIGSTTTAGTGGWRFALPATAATIASGSPGVLNWSYSTSASSNFMIGASPLPNGANTSDNIWMPNQVTAGDWNVMNESSPMVPAATYVLRGWGTYQTAA
ncbi:hypothetical protein ACLVWQ_17510 (plasmid) [Streptomyces sp. CWNU-52B]|uniref:hypothetical protein n=1 Tax=unclassified Streptomyces TaxID=2593676 RepID=UPI0039C46244